MLGKRDSVAIVVIVIVAGFLAVATYNYYSGTGGVQLAPGNCQANPAASQSEAAFCMKVGLRYANVNAFTAFCDSKINRITCISRKTFFGKDCCIWKGSVCGNGVVEFGEECDRNNVSCAIGGYSGVQACNVGCKLGSCTANPRCGDKIVSGNEICDGNLKSCVINGVSGAQKCNFACTGWDSTCLAGPRCGDGICNSGETQTNCCADCGCSSGNYCVSGQCSACIDGDSNQLNRTINNVKYFGQIFAGALISYKPLNGTAYTAGQDLCAGANAANEKICGANGFVVTTKYNCPPNYACDSTGLAKCAEAQACTDSDGGMAYTFAGTTRQTFKNGAVLTLFDSCVSSNVLAEYYCSGIVYSSAQYNCPNGCANGKCN